MDKEIIYVADPMCSWCWGFAPVSRKLADAARGKAPMRVLPGGLRMGGTMPMHAAEAAEIMHHWQEVARRTGQPFDFARPLDDTYVYDTGPACRALALVARLRPPAALDYLHSLHQAFYVGRRDLKDPEVLADYAVSFGIAREAFLEQFESQEARDALDEDLYFVRKAGVRGFPTVLLREGARFQRLTAGYQDFGALEPVIGAWLG